MRSLARNFFLAGAAGLALTGCIELTEQRITIHHDAAADRLVLYLAYDGIQDAPDSPKGAEQIAQLVENGEFMLIDWWGHVERDEIEELANDDSLGPACRELARATLRDIKVETVGHYTSPGGRIGALQRLEIRPASAYIRTLNAALDEAIVADAEDRHGMFDVGKEMPITRRLVEQAARGGHEWVVLERGGIHLRVPMNRREFAAARLEEAVKTMEELGKGGRDGAEAVREHPWTLQALAGTLTSSFRDGVCTFTLGNVDAPDTVRVPLREGYRVGMEPHVKEHAPRDLDRALAGILLAGDAPEPGDALSEYVRIGPPEDRVRAVLAAAKGDDPALREAADRWLEEFAVRWNGSEGLPEAPTGPAERAERLADWDDWYEAMLLFPFPAN